MRQEVWVTSVQERQLAALEPLLADEPLIPLTVVDELEPLESSRLYGRLSLEEVLEIVEWRNKLERLTVFLNSPNIAIPVPEELVGEFHVQFGRDADGREYVQY